MKNSMNAWPEIVFIDGTYKLLNNNLTLVVVAVEDSNGSTNTVAIGLLASENISIFDWFIKTFKKNNEAACTRINCFMADKDNVERHVLRENFENVPVYICVFHSLQAVKRGLKGKGLSVDEQERIYNLFYDLLYSSSEEAYTEQYKKFCKEVPEEILKSYFNKYWFNCQSEWTVYNMKEGNLSNETNNRVESMNQKMKQIIEKRSSPPVFIESLFIFITSHNNAIDYKASQNFMKTKTKYLPDNDQNSYQNLLTEKGFELLMKEWSWYARIKINIISEEKGSYTENGVEFEVTVNDCQCKVRSSSLLPCRHIFAIRKSLSQPLFDEDLCNTRWTKTFYRKEQRMFKQKVTTSMSDIPLISEINSRDIIAEDRINLIKSYMSEIVTTTSYFCNLEFFKRLDILKQISIFWQNKIDISIEESIDKTFQLTQKDIDKQFSQLTIDNKRSISSVPKKRKVIELATNDIINQCSSSSGPEFDSKLNVIKNLKNFLSNNKNIYIKILTCHEVDSENLLTNLDTPNNVSNQVNSNDEHILSVVMPPAIKINGRPRLSLITMPPKYVKKNKKNTKKTNQKLTGKGGKKFMTLQSSKSELDDKYEPIPFQMMDRSTQEVRILEYIFSCTNLDVSIITKTRIKKKDVTGLTVECLKDPIISCNMKIIKKYFTPAAFDFICDLVYKKKSQLKTCKLCSSNIVRESICCEQCLYWFEWRCVGLIKKPSGNWFCNGCKKETVEIEKE